MALTPASSAGGGLSGVTVSDTPAGSGETLVSDSASTASWTPGGASVDPVQLTLGTPTTAFEFDTSSLAGLTAMGAALTTEDANTTIAGNYYGAVAANASVAWKGRYVVQATPFTAVTKLTGFGGFGAFNACALFVGPNAPGALHLLGPRFTSTSVPALQLTTYTSPTGTGTDLGAGLTNVGGAIPMYLAVVANTSDDVDFYYSYNGYIWSRWVANVDPTYTVGVVGIAVNAENATTAAAYAADYLRVWNSVKTLLGSG